MRPLKPTFSAILKKNRFELPGEGSAAVSVTLLEEVTGPVKDEPGVEGEAGGDGDEGVDEDDCEGLAPAEPALSKKNPRLLVHPNVTGNVFSNTLSGIYPNGNAVAFPLPNLILPSDLAMIEISSGANLNSIE